jgi:hypothetical protein
MTFIRSISHLLILTPAVIIVSQLAVKAKGQCSSPIICRISECNPEVRIDNIYILHERHNPAGGKDGRHEYQEKLFDATKALQGPMPYHYEGYDGPWLESRFMTYWRQRKPNLLRVYVPVVWTECVHAGINPAEMQHVLDELDPAYKYFTVVQIAKGFNHPSLDLRVPVTLDFMLFSAGGDSPPVMTTPIPLLKEELRPSGVDKKYTVSFQGSMSTHRIRTALHDQLHRSYPFFEKNEQWKEVIESSNFTLCPRGYGSSSFRLYEALQLGSIPIVVWEEEKWLPFQDILHWTDFSLVVEACEMTRIKELVDHADIAKMQDALLDVQHIFTYDFTFAYIFNKCGHHDGSSNS